jgi:dienelactone hydrolase
VVIGHGFQLAPSQYYGYARRLASFGYVAVTVDFPTGFLGNDNPKEAKDMLGGVAWAKADATIGTKVDSDIIGMTGHSLGGKIALLAATMDSHVKAAFALDPVDGGGPGGCSAPECVAVANLMPSLTIPTGFLGETTDATSNGQACAPAASNFTTFYAKTSSPSLQVTALGANHMSFLDDLAACGFTCSFCNAATATNADVTQMARAFMTAFFERHLRGKTAYDAYLTGAQAQARYVASNRAAIVSK